MYCGCYIFYSFYSNKQLWDLTQELPFTMLVSLKYKRRKLDLLPTPLNYMGKPISRFQVDLKKSIDYENIVYQIQLSHLYNLSHLFESSFTL